MKMAIAMQVHHKPEQINEIIKYFNNEKIDIYIHIDSKSQKIKEKILRQSNVYFTENMINVKWGAISQIDATLELFRSILKNGNYKYIHLISGEDLPLKSLDEFIYYFKDKNSIFIENFKLPFKNWRYGGLDRYKIYHPQWTIIRNKNLFTKISNKIINFCILVQMKSGLFLRNFRFYNDVYGGSQWLSIPGEVAEYILKYLNENPGYYKFFKNTVCSDELFFQTIIMNSRYKDQVVNDNLRYIDWSVITNGSPKVLLREDIERARKTNKIFARKVNDINLYSEINL